MDTFGTIDAYIKTTFMGQTLKTKVITQKDEQCIWDQEMWIPIQWPVASDRLVFRLMDYDTTGDEVVASLVFSIKKIIQ
jgi:Ca2+-dependent lipid-binding protein